MRVFSHSIVELTDEDFRHNIGKGQGEITLTLRNLSKEFYKQFPKDGKGYPVAKITVFAMPGVYEGSPRVRMTIKVLKQAHERVKELKEK